MSLDDPIQLSLQSQFESEKLLRVIKDSADIELLREIAIQLLELNKKKTAIAEWTSRRALEAESKY